MCSVQYSKPLAHDRFTIQMSKSELRSNLNPRSSETLVRTLTSEPSEIPEFRLFGYVFISLVDCYNAASWRCYVSYSMACLYLCVFVCMCVCVRVVS